MISRISLFNIFLFVVTNESTKVDHNVTPGIPSILAYDNFGKKTDIFI
jgi:hypothetical protein